MATIYRERPGEVSFREAAHWSPRLMPLAEALPRLAVSRSNAYRLIARGTFPLPTIRVGARWYVRSADLDALTASD